MRGRCGDGSWVRVVAAPKVRGHPPLWAYEHQQGDEGDATYTHTGAHVVVDPTDPATLGCLLALVREAWGEPMAWLEPRIGCGWVVKRPDTTGAWPGPIPFAIGAGTTEWDALVAALAAAPGRAS